MRCVVAVTLVASAGASSLAFVAPAANGRPRSNFLSVVEQPAEGSSAALLATEEVSSNGASYSSSIGMYCFAAFAALCTASSMRHRAGASRSSKRRAVPARSLLTRRAEGDEDAETGEASSDDAAPPPMEKPAKEEEDTGPGSIAWLMAQKGDYQMGWRHNGQKNYVNPWEQKVEADYKLVLGSDTRQRCVKPTPSGHKFHAYHGPVYKQVPVYEGVEFPLDPKMYYPPLEPPAPGAKWGDGRSPDGNWYMDIEGKQVQYWQGVGRRKTACAIVRIVKGDGQFIVNGTDAIDYFQGYPIHWLKACEPLAALSVKNEYDCLCKAFGGGKSGQAGAIRLGLARSLQELNFEWRPLLKKSKYLTRDWRTVESKKIGKPKARKSKPYHKR